MGQKNSNERLRVITANVDEITRNVKSGRIKFQDRSKYEEILEDYSRELEFILSKSMKPSKISKTEALIKAALQELDALVDVSILQRDINYLTKLQEKETKEKYLLELDEIEKSMTKIDKHLQKYQNFEEEKEALASLKNQLNSIEEIDDEVTLKKSKISSVLTNIETIFFELEMEDKLKQIERKHLQYRVDLNKFVGVPESDAYKKHKQFLLQLKQDVDRISNVTEKIDEKKKYLLYNIDNNILAIEQKVKENKERIKKEIGDNLPETNFCTNQLLVESLIDCYKKFEKGFSADCSLKELKEVFRQLTGVKIKIDQKLQVLENQIDDDHPPMNNRIETVQKEIETIRKEIENSTYSKDSQTYQNFKNKLEGYKTELKILSDGREDNRKFRENILRYADDVSALLDSYTSKRTSTSGDLLIDVMSISTSVDELGAKIKDSGCGLKDYRSIEDSLEEHQYYLRHMEISPARTNICKFRDYVMIQIESHLSNLKRLRASQSGISILGQEKFALAN